MPYSWYVCASLLFWRAPLSFCEAGKIWRVPHPRRSPVSGTHATPFVWARFLVSCSAPARRCPHLLSMELSSRSPAPSPSPRVSRHFMSIPISSILPCPGPSYSECGDTNGVGLQVAGTAKEVPLKVWAPEAQAEAHARASVPPRHAQRRRL